MLILFSQYLYLAISFNFDVVDFDNKNRHKKVTWFIPHSINL